MRSLYTGRAKWNIPLAFTGAVVSLAVAFDLMDMNIFLAPFHCICCRVLDYQAIPYCICSGERLRRMISWNDGGEKELRGELALLTLLTDRDISLSTYFLN
jgi:hypothetical protein